VLLKEDNVFKQLLSRAVLVTLGVAAVLALPAVPAGAQQATTGVTLSTPYAGVAVEPGETASFPLSISAPDGDRVTFTITEAPDGWPVSIRGGGFVVDQVIVDPANMPNLKLEAAVPADAAAGDYKIVAEASSSAGTSTLQLGLRVAEAVGGSITMATDFPALRGASDAKFSFDLTLDNQTPKDAEFSLGADGPSGWTIDVKPSGESQAATLTVAAGDSSRVTVDVTPRSDAPAGSYPITVNATSATATVSTDLTVEITGSYSATLTTPDQRLNADVTAGSSTEVPLVLVNNGTAPLENVTLSPTAPSGWDVTFNPPGLATVAPGDTAQITALITPAQDAVTGDYVVSIQAATPEVQANVDLRTTVKTSEVWGIVSLGLIVAVLAGLGIVFQRFGRR
jgi:uncharacterized membrane protein